MRIADTPAAGTARGSEAMQVTTPWHPAGHQAILRIGAVSAIVGALLALASNLLHPHPTDYQIASRLDAIAQSSTWGALHLMLIVALLFVFVALVALTLSLDREPAATPGRMACVVALMGGVLLLTSTAIDGFAMRQIAETWVAAPAAEQAIVLQNAAALDEAQYAVYSLSIVLFTGIGIVLYGLAAVRSGSYPRWLSWVAIVSGVGEVVVGVVQALSGATYRGAELPDALFAALITLWLLCMGILMWRQSLDQHAPQGRAERRPATA